MGGFNWRDAYLPEHGTDEPIHPDAPASGVGPGFFDTPHGEGWEHSRVPHPDSPEGRHLSVSDLWWFDIDERVEAVERAVKLALRRAPAALREATGEELQALLEGLLPSLLLLLCALAATTAIGAGLGALVGGLLTLGIGAAPGAALGATMGLEAGTVLVEFLGLGFLAKEIIKSLSEAATLATRGFELAWDSVEDSSLHESRVEEAAQRFTEALARVLHGVLQGLMVFLMAKGTAVAGARATELVVRLRSSRLGAGFATWMEQSWSRLAENPRLVPKSTIEGLESAGGGAFVGSDSIANKSVPKPRRGTKNTARPNETPINDNFEELYAKAPAAKYELDAKADEIAAAHGGTVAKAPIKSRARAMEKVANDYDGDPSKIKDLARNTIVVRADKIDAVSDQLAAGGATVKRIDGGTNALGYSGTNASLTTRSGLVGEIQVNSPEMIYAKEPEPVARGILGDDAYDTIAAKTGLPGGQGHALYEQWRELPNSSDRANAIAEQSKAYYNAIRSSPSATK